MDLDSFVVATPRSLPVVLLGSMEGVKIAALNAALKEMGGSATPQGDPRRDGGVQLDGGGGASGACQGHRDEGPRSWGQHRDGRCN